MENKFKAAVGTAAEGNSRKHQQYLPPVVEALPFVMEKGFATSGVDLHSVGSETNSQHYAGEEMETFNWGLTDDSQVSF